MNTNNSRWILLMVLALIWGSSFILMKKALLGLTPVQVGALRMIFSGLALFSVGMKDIKKISRAQWKYVVITALLGTFFPVFLFAYAVENIDSSIVSILNSLTPLNTLIVGVLFYGFAFIRKQFIGVMVGLAGALLLILKGAALRPDQNYLFAIAVVIASVGYAFNVNILKKHLEGLKALTITTANFLVIFIPSVLVLISTNIQNQPVDDQFWTSIFYMLLLSVFGTALAKTIFNKLVKISSPIFSSSVTYLIPVVAIGWGVLDGEKIHFDQLLAGSLVLLGVYLTNSAKK